MTLPTIDDAMSLGPLGLAILGGVVLWIALADAAGVYASRLGRSRVYWFVVSLILSPPVAWAYLVALGPRAVEGLDCPVCAEPVKPEARRCPHCRSDLGEGAPVEDTPRWWSERNREG